MVMRARLRRRTEQRLVAGVAGGIADRLNAPVAFVRTLVALLTAFVPWALWAYAAAALVIPPRGSDRPDWDNVIGLARLGVILGVPRLTAWSGVNLGEHMGGPAGWWIAYYGILIAGAIALLSADYRRGRPRTPAEARAVVLAGLPVAACFAVLGLGLVFAPDLPWDVFVPMAALVGAATLLLASHRGSARPFLAPALLAVAIAGLVAGGGLRLEGGVGNRSATPAPAVSGPIVERQAVGELSLNLRNVTRGGRDAQVEASVGVGTLSVTVPQRARVVVEATTAKGSIDPFVIPNGHGPVQGFDQRESRTVRPERAKGTLPTIHLTADVGLGDIDLRGGAFVEDRS
jgi:phage shock protein PspC (stress-responsive transcriptional regulator)